jgi:hypothetical protein
MEVSIKSGRTGEVASVDGNGRLLTESVTLPVGFYETEVGAAFNINTDIITLTTANKSACIYVKNNEAEDLVIENLIYILGNSTGGTGDVRIDVLRNPSAGTIVSTATPVPIIQNRNFGSAKTLNVDAYKGTEGATFTDGDLAITTILGGAAQRIGLDIGDIVLPNGSSIGIEITPQTSNTSMDIMLAFSCYKVTLTV